jgi:aspartyl-tRNA(Asn)/glutamyl-tRNA(Gln) amidotransferase subunit C
MSLQSQEMVRIASLAKLEINTQELEHMRSSINDFFKIVEAIGSVDTTGVEPLAHPAAIIQEVALRLRDDVVSEPNQREANQQSAPAVDRGLFLVPKVIE